MSGSEVSDTRGEDTEDVGGPDVSGCPAGGNRTDGGGDGTVLGVLVVR